MSYLKIYNGKIITPHRTIKDGSILIKDGKIVEVGNANTEISGALEIDAGGKYIAPGFIDMHVHGGGGHDFMDNTPEAFLEIARTHATFGTTALMPTTLSCGAASLRKTLELYASVQASNHRGARFAGLHIEGPYFSMKQKGAQDPRYIRNPDPEEYETIVTEFPFVKRWSIAPELPGAVAMGAYLSAKQILPSIAHTDAVYEEVLEAYEKGYTHATHFYSCMSGVSRRNAFRYAGVVESAYLIDNMTVEIIADGIHLPPPLLKLVYKIKGADRTALVTDAMRAAGMPEGPSILGSLEDGLPVLIEDGVAKLPNRTAFAGSVATADRLVRNMISLADVPLNDAVKMITETPASILGINREKGSLVCGKDADITIFDETVHIAMTIVNGTVIYQDKKHYTDHIV